MVPRDDDSFQSTPEFSGTCRIKIVFTKSKYLLLELDKFEAEFYHLPDFVPYFNSDQKKLSKDGFQWDLSVEAMRKLIKEDDCDEYKLYRLFVRKWPLYDALTQAIQTEQYTEAEKIAEQILAIDLLDPSVYLNLASVLCRQGHYYKAEQTYHKGLDLVKHRIPFLIGLAELYEALGKLEDAIHMWNQVLEESGENVEAIENLIKHQVYQNSQLDPGINFERLMMKEFQKAFNNVDTLTKLGVKLVHYKLTKLAVKVFERVYQLSDSTAKQAIKAS